MSTSPAFPLTLGRRYQALCLGLNACDHLCLVPGPPTWGGKLQMSDFATSGGGQAATCACALARLGHEVAYAGVHGDDEVGQRAGPWLRQFGVEPAGLVTKLNARSQQAFIMVEEGSAERTIIWHRDDACRLEPSDLDAQLIASCQVLHLDGHFLEASIAAAEIARAHGVVVSLDGERVFPGTEKLVALCQVVMGCHDYPQRLTGINDPRKSLEALAAMGPVWVGRTLGGRGAEMLADGRYYHQQGFAVKAIDTTGAGDVFHAGMVHAILQGHDAPEALRISCALAAISVTALGGRSSLADGPQLRRFLDQQAR